MKLIERSYYLNKLQAVKDIPDIKVITGLRRSGENGGAKEPIKRRNRAIESA